MSLVQKYKEQLKKIQEAKKALKSTRKKIVDIKYFPYERPAGKCVGQFNILFVKGDDEFQEIENCPEFCKAGGCTKTDCPGYKNYSEYMAAKKNYKNEEHELYRYPLWVEIAALIKDRIRK